MIDKIKGAIEYRLANMMFGILIEQFDYQIANNQLVAEFGPQASELFIFQLRELAISINRLKAEIIWNLLGSKLFHDRNTP